MEVQQPLKFLLAVLQPLLAPEFGAHMSSLMIEVANMNFSDHPLARIAVVSSNSFDFEGPETACDEASPPGKQFANFILKRLIANGVTCISNPVTGTEGWEFAIKIAGMIYLVFVHWAPIGRPPENHWIIQPDIDKGLFRALVGRKTSDSEITPVVLELKRAMEGAVEIDDVKWITQKEFTDIY